MVSRFPMSSISRILIVRSLPGLGDLLCSVPALRSLRATFPDAQITWLGLPDTEWFGQRFGHLVDDWLSFPGFPGIPEGWQSARKTIEFLQQAQTLNFDLTVQMHGSGIYINPFLTLLGGKQQAGFYLPGQFCPDDRYFLPYPEGVSEIDRLLKLVTFLGMPHRGSKLEFPLKDEERKAGFSLMETHSLEPGRYVCVHPGASCGDRCWPLAKFAQVARWFSERGYPIVVTGSLAERDLAHQLIDILPTSPRFQPINLAGATRLSHLAVLLQHSALLICNDTGVSHLAAALQVPSVIVFSNSDVQRWAPGDRALHCVVDCRQTQTDTAAQVIAQAQDLLQRPKLVHDTKEVWRAG